MKVDRQRLSLGCVDASVYKPVQPHAGRCKAISSLLGGTVSLSVCSRPHRDLLNVPRRRAQMLTGPMCLTLATGDSPGAVSVPVQQQPRAVASLQGMLWGHRVLAHGRRGREA